MELVAPGGSLAWHISEYKSSHQESSIKISVRKNFAIFTGKHLCWSLFLIKLQA